ncbi:hypothetical protein Enr13x_39200 [Stieleria neptunia]|uniref:BNR/Asp-box repeat protein n=1 Tax=Stieleria neptunia TaxID=2527979 RepID=A0A518HT71_9BACT|nr:BNR repeat-containing protein [Stieleria neptunia]QDV44059.1 hypothetical protein Enr13x_39200 [Stieleria neptunia]
MMLHRLHLSTLVLYTCSVLVVFPALAQSPPHSQLTDEFKSPLSNASGSIQTSTVDEKALTFAVGPASKFGNTVNGRTHQQEALITYRGHQYATYVDASRRICIGRRELPSSPWEIIRFDDHRFESNDSHNTSVIGICDKDGSIHMAFDHHATQLNYRVSKLGVAHAPESTPWTADLFGPITHTLGSVTTDERVTYPRFFPAPNGNLMFYYRSVTSADGDGMIEEYDGEQHDWTPGLGKFIARDVGTFKANGRQSQRRCPYMNALTFSGQRLHASWVWRERFERTNVANQHDLCYAYSDDHGRTWCNSAGTIIGRTGQDFIHLDSPGLVVAEIPIHSGLSNQNTHYAYPDGSIHIMLRHRLAGEPSAAPELRYFHYWRDSEGNWNHEALPIVGRRPKLLGTPDRKLVLVYSDEGELFLAKGLPDAARQSWRWSQLRLPRRYSAFGDAVVDFARWEQDHTLSVYHQDEPSRIIVTDSPDAIDGPPSPLRVSNITWDQLPILAGEHHRE